MFNVNFEEVKGKIVTEMRKDRGNTIEGQLILGVIELGFIAAGVYVTNITEKAIKMKELNQLAKKNDSKVNDNH